MRETDISTIYDRPELSRLVISEVGQAAIHAAEDVVFDEMDRLIEPLGLPMRKEYHPIDLKRLGVEARWGGLPGPSP